MEEHDQAVELDFLRRSLRARWDPEALSEARDLLVQNEIDHDRLERLARREGVSALLYDLLRGQDLLPPPVENALRRGREALAAGDAGAASEAFALADSVDPGNAAAAEGASRAAVLDDVLALVADGRRREKRGDLIGAEVSYRRAAELDTASREAAAALEQVR